MRLLRVCYIFQLSSHEYVEGFFFCCCFFFCFIQHTGEEKVSGIRGTKAAWDKNWWGSRWHVISKRTRSYLTSLPMCPSGNGRGVSENVWSLPLLQRTQQQKREDDDHHNSTRCAFSEFDTKSSITRYIFMRMQITSALLK